MCKLSTIVHCKGEHAHAEASLSLLMTGVAHCTEHALPGDSCQLILLKMLLLRLQAATACAGCLVTGITVCAKRGKK